MDACSSVDQKLEPTGTSYKAEELKVTSFPKERSTDAELPFVKNSLDSESSTMLQSPVVDWLMSTPDSKEKTSNDVQASLESDSEAEEFFSVKGAFSNASSRQSSLSGSPAISEKCDSKEEASATEEKKKKLVDLFQDPFWSDQVDNHISIIPTCRDIKLVELLNDDCWSEEAASVAIRGSKIKSKSAVYDISPINGSTSWNNMRAHDSSHLGQENSAMATPCCLPILSPSRGSRERKGSPT